MPEAARGDDRKLIASTGGETVIQSNDDLARHLRIERDVYARALEMYRTGRMSFVASNVDISTYQMTDLLGIINTIDQLLERMEMQESLSDG